MSARARIAGFILLAGALGCGQQRDDCRTLIDTVGPRLAAIRALEQAKASDAGSAGAALEATSAAYAELAERLEHTPLATLKSEHVAGEYRQVARDLATELRNLAVAVDKEDDALLKAATKRLKQLAQDEQRMSRLLVNLCGKP